MDWDQPQGQHMNARFRRLTDLFVDGTILPLPDGTYLWVQALNSYERDECLVDAQTARARIVLSAKRNPAERDRITARLVQRGRETLIEDLASAKADQEYGDIVARIEDDPEWKERVEIMRRTDYSQSAKPPTAEEKELLLQIQGDYAKAITTALADERDFQRRHYEPATDEQIIDDYMEMWVDKRAGDRAAIEYTLTEIWYSTRYCEATPLENGDFDHTPCDSHKLRVFDTKEDARSAPDKLTQLVSNAIAELQMAARDPKGSGSPASSSDSSPTPSEAEESTPSTSTETQDEAPGISSQLLATP